MWPPYKGPTPHMANSGDFPTVVVVVTRVIQNQSINSLDQSHNIIQIHNNDVIMWNIPHIQPE